MKTRVLLLAGFLAIGAGCGNKDANGEKKQAAPPNILQVDPIELGTQRITLGEFLRERPRLQRLVKSSDPQINGVSIKFRRYSYILEIYSNGRPIGYQFGSLQRSHDRLLLDPNFGHALPFKTADGELCAHVHVNAPHAGNTIPARPASTLTVCEENEYADDYDRDDQDNRRRRHF